MRKLKVYGGLMAGRGRVQTRTIVAAASRAEVGRITGLSQSYLRDFWSETGNAREVATAMSRPGVVFQASGSMSKDFEAQG